MVVEISVDTRALAVSPYISTTLRVKLNEAAFPGTVPLSVRVELSTDSHDGSSAEIDAILAPVARAVSS
jgi:hypothetical protein